MNKRKYNIDEEWLSLIQECRSSGLTIVSDEYDYVHDLQGTSN